MGIKELKTEQDAGIIIRRTLRGGVILSVVFLIAGLAAAFWPPMSVLSRILLSAGLLILVLTPVLRIIMLVYSYHKIKARRYELYAAAVLALLFLSVILK